MTEEIRKRSQLLDKWARSTGRGWPFQFRLLRDPAVRRPCRMNQGTALAFMRGVFAAFAAEDMDVQGWLIDIDSCLAASFARVLSRGR